MAKHDMVDNFGVEKMGKDEHQKMFDYVQKNCKCPECPTYVEGDTPVGYCFPVVGTSKKIQWEKECICESCPIFKEFELNHNHYCTRCSQYCQNLKREAGAGQGGAG